MKLVNIEILEKDDEHIKFVIENVTNSFVNSLRRVLISEIPTMAIVEVWIVENNTVLYDKILSHRLGLIPLKTDLDTYKFPEECECVGTGCPQCRVSFTLSQEAINEDLMVYSGHLEPADPKVVPVSDKIPIVKLIKGQKVVLEAYGSLGIGKKHAKWQSSTTSSFKNYPNVEIDYDKCTNCEDCITACPRNVFVKKAKKVVVEQVLDCTLCKECIKICEDAAVNLSWADDKFIFNVETSGAMPPEELIKQALQVLNKKAEGFLAALKDKLSNGSDD